MFDVGCGKVDVQCGMFDVGCSMWDVGWRMFDVGWRMFDVGCGMADMVLPLTLGPFRKVVWPSLMDETLITTGFAVSRAER
jgi:hypothetical protein